MRKGRIVLEIVFVAILSVLISFVLVNTRISYYDYEWERRKFASIDYSIEMAAFGIGFFLLILIWEWMQRKSRGDSRSFFEKYLYFIGLILVFISIIIVARFFLLT